jgi:hypothetical protein
MDYVRPEDVRSPQEHWLLEEVLDAGEEGKSALAIGLWGYLKMRGQERPRPVLVMRRNGYNEKGREKGDPTSTCQPTWFVIEGKYYEAILGDAGLTDGKLARARGFLDWTLHPPSRPDRQTRGQEQHVLPQDQPSPMRYIEPKDVRSPKGWALIEVLDAGEEGTTALAIGRWDEKQSSSGASGSLAGLQAEIEELKRKLAEARGEAPDVEEETKTVHPLASPPVLTVAMRWNGFDEPHARPEERLWGHPSNGSNPRWFVIDEKYCEAILRSGLLAPDKLAIARRYFPER